MSDQDLKNELEGLRKENEALKKGASSTIRMKVSEKGAVSIYGIGRFPVTLRRAMSTAAEIYRRGDRAVEAAHASPAREKPPLERRDFDAARAISLLVGK